MKAYVRKNENNVYIIDLKGKVDFASAEPFRETCINNLTQKNIVFNLKGLDFVGSDGLSSFMDTLKELKKHSSLKFCCVGSEFMRFFNTYKETKDLVIYEDEQSAKNSF